MKKRLKIFLGLLLMPLFISLYYNDRVILFLLPHLEQPAIQKWFQSNKSMTNSIIRIVVFWSSIALYKFLSWLIG